ncbi:winged helix DNA-binding domain-containing protein [Lysobacter sp. CFH 32150]|uniref:winged helix DNA-binding domain-containing protein n=1 Tax=Lysobacter sp. CFH 32150 TaxID=2927128 RepID=UPI001FA74716|nr:winged helix DNA-binding domain-containing protein [Lysobacter sp. CFH 32150]MCI4567915.1 winged helix DNA-binding domain-containing protein [Lysobacter sp. CFH 32150]
MTTRNLLKHRLHAQGIATARFDTPADVVRWLVAMQAQDYYGALWAVGLRMRAASEAVIEQAIAERRIVRTWPMRGTLHFVAAEDARWMLELLTPRVIALNAARIERDFGLDAAMLTRCRRIVGKALAGGKALTRGALYAALDEGGVSCAEQRGIHVTGRLAQEGLICLGPRAGKQPTFVLLDEWLPAVPRKTREEALAELAHRYFRSRGPATAQDFAWWSNLTVKDAQAGIALAQSRLVRDVVDGSTYWLSPDATPSHKSSAIHLLPPFDEYLVAYKDRSAALDTSLGRQVIGINGLVNASIIRDGRVAGVWKRAVQKQSVMVLPNLFASLPRAQHQALARTTKQYGAFLGLPVTMP